MKTMDKVTLVVITKSGQHLVAAEYSWKEAEAVIVRWCIIYEKIRLGIVIPRDTGVMLLVDKAEDIKEDRIHFALAWDQIVGMYLTTPKPNVIEEVMKKQSKLMDDIRGKMQEGDEWKGDYDEGDGN